METEVEPDAVCYSKAAFVAAVNALSRPTFEEAKKNPVVIQYHTTRMTFKEGIHETRAKELVRNITKGVKDE